MHAMFLYCIGRFVAQLPVHSVTRPVLFTFISVQINCIDDMWERLLLASAVVHVGAYWSLDVTSCPVVFMCRCLGGTSCCPSTCS